MLAHTGSRPTKAAATSSADEGASSSEDFAACIVADATPSSKAERSMVVVSLDLLDAEGSFCFV